MWMNRSPFKSKKLGMRIHWFKKNEQKISVKF